MFCDCLQSMALLAVRCVGQQCVNVVSSGQTHIVFKYTCFDKSLLKEIKLVKISKGLENPNLVY